MSLYQFWNLAMQRACDEGRQNESHTMEAARAWRTWRFRRWDR